MQPATVTSFLQGGGEMGKLTSNFDWSQSVLGEPDTWPQSLRIHLNLLLNSKFPMLLFWGPELINFYNDAFIPSLGNDGKHPSILGMPAKKAWSEVWDFTGPLVDKIVIGSEAVWFEDQLVPIYRNGRMQEVYWTFSYSPVFDDDGVCNGVFVTCTETTKSVLALQQLTKTSQQLAESETRFRNIVDEAPVAIAIFRGPEHIIELANEEQLLLWGRTAEQVISQPLFDVLPEAKGKGYEELLHKVMDTGTPFHAKELSAPLLRNGVLETVYFNFVYQPVREADGTITGVSAAAIEITQQVLARQKIEEEVTQRTAELAEANLLLKQNNQELEQFAYIASHDLQEPLRKVITFGQMLKSHLGVVDERAENYFEKISSATVRMMDLIRDVLDFSQLSSQRQVFEQIDVQKILEVVTADYELLIEQKKAVIECGHLPTLQANALQMRQLFTNLLSNALKFSAEGRPPVISITSQPLSDDEKAHHKDLLPEVDYCQITVADNGIGFNKEHALKIFSIFQRLHGKSEFAGTGIGLAICKKIAHNHYGEIWATSQPDQGAKFNIILPCPK